MFYDRAKKLKAKYTALHATVVKTYKATQELHKSVKEKNSQLLAEKIKLERQKISQVEEKANADKLRRARDMTKLRRHDEAEKLTNLLALKQEKLQDRKMNEKHVDRLKVENEKILKPQIEAVNVDIQKLQVRLGGSIIMVVFGILSYCVRSLPSSRKLHIVTPYAPFHFSSELHDWYAI